LKYISFQLIFKLNHILLKKNWINFISLSFSFLVLFTIFESLFPKQNLINNLFHLKTDVIYLIVGAVELSTSWWERVPLIKNMSCFQHLANVIVRQKNLQRWINLSWRSFTQ